MPSQRFLTGFCIVAGLLTFAGCTSHHVKIEPVEIKPIHLVIDNNMKVDKALDDFFGDLDNGTKSASNGHSASIKEDMATRIPAIDALKDQGIVGDNNKGLLEYRSDNKPQQELVNAENRDRSAVYEAIGKSEGAAATPVAERRAKKIAESGASGHWLQKADGTWYQQ